MTYIRWTLTLLSCCIAFWIPQQHETASGQVIFDPSKFGIKYSHPSDYFTRCTNFRWLRGSAYTNGCGGSVSPKQELVKELSFIQTQHLGSFLRVWISLDQLFGCWSASTGFCGYDATSLANLDDALHQFAAHGTRIELGLLVWEVNCDPTLYTSPFQNCFHPEALDGNHPAMRANYLTAVRQFMAHLAANPIDAWAVRAIDLYSEGYYQQEVYFDDLKNYPSTSHLGKWNYSMPSWPVGTQCYVLGNTVCTGGSAGHGCLSGSNVDTTCVDVNIIEPWLHDLYATAKSASSSFLLTVGDTGRLLTTDTGTYTGQQHWISLYSPVSDIYDIHLYEDAPWNQAARWASWVHLDKPYFVGEAGCATNNSPCTYNTQSVSAPLQWWLNNLVQHYGARSVEIEDGGTVWKYVYVNGQGAVPQLTPSGAILQTLAAG